MSMHIKCSEEDLMDIVIACYQGKFIYSLTTDSRHNKFQLKLINHEKTIEIEGEFTDGHTPTQSP